VSNIEARLARLESDLGPVEPPDPWDGFDEAAKSAMARAGLEAAEIACKGLDPWPYRTARPEAEAAALAAAGALEARLRKAGLLIGPLGEAQKVRVHEIAAELSAALGQP
jgi:hypothetical protein